MDRMRIGYLGYGSYIPSVVVTNEDLERIVDTSDEWIQQRTGIQTRFVMNKNESVLQMAVEASKRALADAGLSPDDIGDIRVGVNTWNRFPSLATQVQYALGTKESSASDVSAGCSGFIYAVEDAFNKIVIEKMKYGRDVKTLVIGVDGLSLVVDWTDRTTCVLLADGAGAVVMGRTEDNEILATCTEAAGKYGDLLYLDEFLNNQLTGENQVCFSNEKKIDRPFLHMQGKKVFPVAVRTMISNMKKVIERYNASSSGEPIRLTDVEYVFPHQANLRIIKAIADFMKMPLESIYTDGIKKYGNTSAASIPIGYVDTLGKVKGKIVIDVAFGSGFASGAILRRA
ncbi:MAG: beta-ketoacyl-ACP synthase 3 [Gemmatimonadota bacterium]|nr:MAG: beta-ketoacyl-ACP synthase 3 [Gemmatimonadota bacterium]